MWKYAIFYRNGSIARSSYGSETRKEIDRRLSRSLAGDRIYGDLNDVIMTDVYRRDERDGVAMCYVVHFVYKNESNEETVKFYSYDKNESNEETVKFYSYHDALELYLKHENYLKNPDKYPAPFYAKNLESIYITRRAK